MSISESCVSIFGTFRGGVDCRVVCFSGLGFEVSGLWFEVLGLGFEVWGLGFEVWGLGFEVLGLGFEVLGLGFEVLGRGYNDTRKQLAGRRHVAQRFKT